MREGSEINENGEQEKIGTLHQSITYESDVLVKMKNTSLYKLLKTNDEKLVEQFNKVEELKKSSERMTTEDDNKISEYFSRMQEIKRLIGINVFKISIVIELVDLYQELLTAQNVQDAMTVLKKIEFKFLEQKIARRFKMSLSEADSND